MASRYTDVEFEVISDPRALPGPKGSRYTLRQWLSGIYTSIIVFFALVTLAVGLAGGDIDTTDDDPSVQISTREASSETGPLRAILLELLAQSDAPAAARATYSVDDPLPVPTVQSSQPQR